MRVLEAIKKNIVSPFDLSQVVQILVNPHFPEEMIVVQTVHHNVHESGDEII